jgi:hypothetical protein
MLNPHHDGRACKFQTKGFARTAKSGKTQTETELCESTYLNKNLLKRASEPKTSRSLVSCLNDKHTIRLRAHPTEPTKGWDLCANFS